MKTFWRVLVSLCVAGALLAALMAWGGLGAGELFATLGKLSFATYLAALGLHVGLYVLRTVRFRVLIPPAQRPGFGRLAAVCAAHTLAAFVLPAKLGEATFVVYAREVCGLPASAGLASLVVSRLLDLASLAASFGLACLVLAGTRAYPSIEWFLPVGGLLLALATLLFAVSARGDLLVRLAVALSRGARLDRFAPGRRLLGRVEEVALALRAAGGERRLYLATAVSVPIWLFVFLFCAVLARGLGLPPETSLAAATFAASLAILTSLLPLSAFASFGTLEAGWVIGFGTLGVPRDLALATGTGLHLVQLANILVLGLLGHLGMGLFSRARR